MLIRCHQCDKPVFIAALDLAQGSAEVLCGVCGHSHQVTSDGAIVSPDKSVPPSSPEASESVGVEIASSTALVPQSDTRSLTKRPLLALLLHRKADVGITVSATAVAFVLAFSSWGPTPSEKAQPTQTELGCVPTTASATGECEQTTTVATGMLANAQVARPQPTRSQKPAAAPATKTKTRKKKDKVSRCYQRGNRYLQENKVKSAVQELEACIALAPDHVLALRSLGVAYFRLNDTGKARRAYRKFVQLAPSHPDAPTIRNIIASLETR